MEEQERGATRPAGSPSVKPASGTHGSTFQPFADFYRKGRKGFRRGTQSEKLPASRFSFS